MTADRLPARAGYTVPSIRDAGRAEQAWRIEHENGHHNSDKRRCPHCRLAARLLGATLRAFNRGAK